MDARGQESLEAASSDVLYESEDATYYLNWLASQLRERTLVEFSGRQLRSGLGYQVWRPVGNVEF